MTQPLVQYLKNLIDENGHDYLHEKPYEVFQQLKKNLIVDEKTSGIILLALVNEIDKKALLEDDLKRLSTIIQNKCEFKKKAADTVAEIFLELYSQENKANWKTNNLSGWDEFIKSQFWVTWEGASMWGSHGVHKDYGYELEIELKPLDNIKQDEELSKLIDKNPFMSLEEIQDIKKKKLINYLDDELDRYVCSDDYYEPVIEDFDVDYYIEEWCKKYGFKLLNSEGEGQDSDYESDF